jgi:medium-chain acyl-[acyl-carrier-protein] hydrolase
VSQTNLKPTGPLPWFQVQPRSAARIRLFCFPYAGGSSAIFRPWSRELPREIELVPALLPGREFKLREPAYTRIELLVETLTREITPFLDKPFAFFGHSMGALIAFELARRLRDERGIEPEHLFISGRRSPRVPRRDPHIHELPDAEFSAELEKMNGTPREVLEHQELMEILSPMLRADFALCHEYIYIPSEPLRCPITVLGGTRDEDAPDDELDAWCKETIGKCSVKMLEGDHFFINQQHATILPIIQRALVAHIQPF